MGETHQHQEKLDQLRRVFSDSLQYFPGLEEQVDDHLSEWSGFDASAETSLERIKRLSGSLIAVADTVAESLIEMRDEGKTVVPPSVVRPSWRRKFTDGLYGFLSRGREKGYLVYGHFRREAEGYSDLIVLFQMLQPGEDTGEEGQEVHCRFLDVKDKPTKAVAQGVEVYRVLAGFVEIEVDGERRTVGPEYDYDTVIVPPGSRHRVMNTSGKTSKLLIVMGGGITRGRKIREDGKIEVTPGGGQWIGAPDAPEKYKEMLRFRKRNV